LPLRCWPTSVLVSEPNFTFFNISTENRTRILELINSFRHPSKKLKFLLSSALIKEKKDISRTGRRERCGSCELEKTQKKHRNIIGNLRRERTGKQNHLIEDRFRALSSSLGKSKSVKEERRKDPRKERRPNTHTWRSRVWATRRRNRRYRHERRRFFCTYENKQS
jgi:hypothetical protein